MSVRTSLHFMSHCGGALPKVELRQHPRLPIMILTLVDGDHDFVWSDTAERMRELFTAILADPALAHTVAAAPVRGEYTDEEAWLEWPHCSICKRALHLEPGCEWPEDKSLALCGPCACGEAERLRAVIAAIPALALRKYLAPAAAPAPIVRGEEK